jgi:hypothetical protein
MQSKQLIIHHLNSFSKLSLADRLAWAFDHHRFLSRFMDAKAKQLNRIIRRNGKKYFTRPDMA